MNALCTDYMERFLAGLSDGAHIAAAITQEREIPFCITISQRLTMDSSPLIVGVAASFDAFCAVASGYSSIALSGMDDLVVDAVSEWFNVINGHFSSRMREHGTAVSIIDPPHHYHGTAVPSSPLFDITAACSAGILRIMGAQDEFLPVRKGTVR